MSSQVIRTTLGVALLVSLLLAPPLVSADMIRGLENYLAIMKGEKKIDQLSSEEVREVLLIHSKLSNAGSSPKRSDGYEIEASVNDEWFVINGEKYQAKTYCFNFDKGDYVKFLEGSPFGACASAKLLNLRSNKICDVWCE